MSNTINNSVHGVLDGLYWISYIGCVWMNQNYRNLLLPCIPDTLHCPGSQISLIIINRHQVAGLIHHVAIPLDITLTAILVSNDFFPAAMLQDELHPALAALIPLGVMADKRKGYDQFNITISWLLLQAENFFRRPHIYSQSAANIKAPDRFFIMQFLKNLPHGFFNFFAERVILRILKFEAAWTVPSNGTSVCFFQKLHPTSNLTHTKMK